MRHALRFGLGMFVVLATCGFAVMPPMPYARSPFAAAVRWLVPPVPLRIQRALPAPQSFTPSLTIDTKHTVRFLATQA